MIAELELMQKYDNYFKKSTRLQRTSCSNKQNITSWQYKKGGNMENLDVIIQTSHIQHGFSTGITSSLD